MGSGSSYHPNPLSVPHTLGDLKKSGGHPQTPARGRSLWTSQFYLAIVIRTGTTPVPPVLPRKDTSFRNRMWKGTPCACPYVIGQSPAIPHIFLSLSDLIGQSRKGIWLFVSMGFSPLRLRLLPLFIKEGARGSSHPPSFRSRISVRGKLRPESSRGEHRGSPLRWGPM